MPWGPPRRHQLVFFLCYSRINVFMEWDICDFAIGHPRSKLWRKLVWLRVSGVCGKSSQAPGARWSCCEGGVSSGGLWHWECDCQRGSWAVRLGSFLNIYYRSVHLSLFYKQKPHNLFINFSAVIPYSELWLLLPVLVTLSSFTTSF